MFDIGFFELVLVAIVALLVLGPERLPHAVRMAGAFVGKIRRMMINVREEFEREVNMAEMQQRIKEQLEKAGLDDARKAVEDARQRVAETHQAVENSIAPPPPRATADTNDDANTRHNEPSPENAAPAPPPEPELPTDPESTKPS